MSAQTFYRWHHHHAPTFTADNAWSADWGSDFTGDGTAYTCLECEGTGECDPRDCRCCDAEGCWYCDDTGTLTECTDCDGAGTIDCERGYSCTWEAAELVAYFRERGGEPRDAWGLVYVFEGEMTGSGTDGEPLAVPEQVVETLTWSQLVERAAREEAA